MRKLLWLASAMLVCLGLIGCSGSEPDVKNTQPSSETSSADTAQREPTAQSDQAQTTGSEPEALTGKVVVYMPSPAGLADKLAAGFQAATGIKVEQFQGTTGEILARLEAEAANPVADVVILASWADGLSLKNAGKLLSYAPANSDKVYPTWKDDGNFIFGTSASAVGVIYNTTIFPQVSADWAELADEKYKDQLAIPDPEKSGSCKDFLSGYLNNKGETEGWAVWESLAANGMTVPGANAAALEAVTTGSKGILVAGVDYNAYSSKAKGEPVDIYYPAGGTVINPRPAMILKTSPNVGNAKAFMDYLLSNDAQNLVAKAYLLPGRNDITSPNRANVSDIPVLVTDWDWMVANAGAIAKKLNTICAK
ncbi:MAG: ABC transporter substrate-binding protein [Deltaproteobacteria bacterium]|jgi:iron(III) transport system substrate-binding protein|nr:ABC transporter substrate-binding protein [Deltaproteobacteria bacterium]